MPRKLPLSSPETQAAKPAGLRPRSNYPYPSSRKYNTTLFRHLQLAALASGILLAVQQTGWAQSLQSEQAAASQNFVNMAGVVTHFNYTNTVYGSNWQQLFQALQTLGVHHIRDGYFDPTQYPQLIAEHQQLQAAGIRTTYVMPYDPSITSGSIEQLANETGDMDAIEGPNECDILGQCGGGGLTGILDGVAVLPALQTAAQNLNVPLVAPSFVLPSSYPLAGNLDSLVNLNTLHVYFGGRNPGSNGWGDYDAQGNSYGSFNYWLDQAAIDAPGKASEIGETGYISFPSTSTPYTVPESVTASYVPRTMLLAFKHGYDKTFFYQLVDDPTSVQGYGLLRSDFSQKPGFTALANLLSLLSDSGGSNFTPGSLPFTILGGDSNVNHLLLQKSDGSYWLALWLEEPSWDPANVVSLPVAPENIGIQLGSGYQTTTDYQFDSSGNVVPFNQPMNGNIAPLTVTDQVSIVQIVPQ
jgi:hypothetical protein